MVEYAKFRNKNWRYRKLEVWQKSIELYNMIWKIIYEDLKLDFKLRSQLADATQSVSSNTAEGYSRRSIKEYIQFLYILLFFRSLDKNHRSKSYQSNSRSTIQYDQLGAL